MTPSYGDAVRRPSDTSSDGSPMLHDSPSSPSPLVSTRAGDKGIRIKDTRHELRIWYDGIEWPYMLDELMAECRVSFARTPVNERCVFRNAKYLGEARIGISGVKYAIVNHVWRVDFLRANNTDFAESVEGLLTIWCRKWRNEGLGDPRTAFAGLCAVNADKRRNIVAVECNLEVSL